MNQTTADKIARAQQMVGKNLGDVHMNTILAMLPPITDAQAKVLAADPALRNQVMKQFGNPDLFFAWLKKTTDSGG